MTILVPVAVMGGIGIIAGAILALAAKFMSVPVDERVGALRGMLPGANCGACGFAGCDEYAEALAAGSAKSNLCTPGGADTAKSIGEYLGTGAEAVTARMAVVRCSGTCGKNGFKAEYTGPATCEACTSIYQGNRNCTYGCLGFGDCLHACQFGAIYMEDGIAHIDPELCTACGMCVTACPKLLITITPKAAKTVVACHSTEPGAVVRKLCSAGCIGCKLCEKKCDYDAITVTNNLAVIDPEKCTNCGACVEACPTKVIVQS